MSPLGERSLADLRFSGMTTARRQNRQRSRLAKFLVTMTDVVADSHEWHGNMSLIEEFFNGDDPGRISLPVNVEHGSINAYVNLGCRCAPCKLAWRNYQLKVFETRRAKSLTDPDDPRHGTYQGYSNYGCRCSRCKEANRLYGIGYKVKRGRISVHRAVALGWKPPDDIG